MSLVSGNSSPMEKEVAVDVDMNVIRSASSPPPSELMINLEEKVELPSFDSISQPSSDNSSQLEEAFVPIGSPAYMSLEFLESKPLSPRLYEGAAYNLRFVEKTRTPARRAPVDLPDVMSIVQSLMNALNLLTGGAPPQKKLTPVEEEVEIRKSIVGAYQTITKWKTLTVSQLDDIWSRINMLEEDMQESQDNPLSSCGKYRETIGPLKTEFRSLLSFVAPNLRGTCQLHALMRKVDRGRDLERAQISTGSIGESIGIESWADSLNLSTVISGGDTDRKILEDRMLKLRIGYHAKKEIELEEAMDIWNSIKRFKEEDHDQEELNSLMFQFSSVLQSFTTNAIQLSHHIFKKRFLDLLREVNDYMDLERAPIFTGLAGEDSTSTIFDSMNPTDGFLIGDAAMHPLHGNIAKTSIASFGIGNTTQKGKMKGESYKDPLLPQKNNQARELEDLSNFAFLGLIMCYAVLYFLYSAFLGKKGSNTRVMTGLHIWTALLLLLLFIGSFIRFSVGTLKVMRLVMSGLLLVSSSLAFILLQLGLYESNPE